MHIDILSLFPGYFQGPFAVSIIKRAIDAGILSIDLVDIRLFSKDKHKKVDDRPFGGGPGMVLSVQPVMDAIRSRKKTNSRVVYLSPQGTLFNAKKAQELSSLEHLIFLCGHYEGIDERVQTLIDEEISIGDYVLTNGCLSAIVVVDALSRFIPGVLGDEDSVNQESFQNDLFDAPHYTRPEEFEGLKVPAILLEGHHAKIDKWRKEKSMEKTKKIRPDLYEKYLLKAKV